MPALFTSTSTSPTCPASFATPLVVRRSAAMNSALPPCSRSAATTFLPRAWSRPVIVTCAPARARRRAIASPMPEVPPVTNTRRPLNCCPVFMLAPCLRVWTVESKIGEENWTVKSKHVTFRAMANANAPATAKGRAKRKRILQAAAELVADKGAAGVSLDEVQVRTGTSRSQLYHYFEDRDDLLHAVIDVTTDAVLDRQGELLQHLDSWAGIDRWFDFLVQHQIERQACGGCPIGSLAGQLAEIDAAARAAIAAGLERWEAHLRDGLIRMKTRGKLRQDADLAALATATMASIQGGLLLTQVRRDPRQLRIALNAARANLRLAASVAAPETRAKPRP